MFRTVRRWRTHQVKVRRNSSSMGCSIYNSVRIIVLGNINYQLPICNVFNYDKCVSVVTKEEKRKHLHRAQVNNDVSVSKRQQLEGYYYCWIRNEDLMGKTFAFLPHTVNLLMIALIRINHNWVILFSVYVHWRNGTYCRIDSGGKCSFQLIADGKQEWKECDDYEEDFLPLTQFIVYKYVGGWDGKESLLVNLKRSIEKSR